MHMGKVDLDVHIAIAMHRKCNVRDIYICISSVHRKSNRVTHPKPHSEISSELHLKNVHVHEMSSTQHILSNVGYHTITYTYCVSEKLIFLA